MLKSCFRQKWTSLQLLSRVLPWKEAFRSSELFTGSPRRSGPPELTNRPFLLLCLWRFDLCNKELNLLLRRKLKPKLLLLWTSNSRPTPRNSPSLKLTRSQLSLTFPYSNPSFNVLNCYSSCYFNDFKVTCHRQLVSHAFLALIHLMRQKQFQRVLLIY